jgi:catechol 2,3-dioxygenase-like lactoylglutathione lyase family enzyme
VDRFGKAVTSSLLEANFTNISTLIMQNSKLSASCGDLAGLEQECVVAPICPMAKHHNWTIVDAVSPRSEGGKVPKIPMTAFNHVSREVLSLEKSKRFYVDILGFEVIPRPPFDCEGYWLYGHGLNLHLVATSVPNERKKVKVARIQHFSTALPRVDHIAFLTSDIEKVREVMDHHQVYYKYEVPDGTGIRQIFLFDPDGNVIEISNCAPAVGETTCND